MLKFSKSTNGKTFVRFQWCGQLGNAVDWTKGEQASKVQGDRQVTGCSMMYVSASARTRHPGIIVTLF